MRRARAACYLGGFEACRLRFGYAALVDCAMAIDLRQRWASSPVYSYWHCSDQASDRQRLAEACRAAVAYVYRRHHRQCIASPDRANALSVIAIVSSGGLAKR